MEKLLYRMVGHNGGAVFASENRAVVIAQIHCALKAENWGDFRQRMPAAEYERVMRVEFNEVEQERPADTERFWGIAGSTEGDYPSWLQPMMDYLLPADLLQRYAVRRDTFTSESYYEIYAEQVEPLAAALRDRGYEVERAANCRSGSPPAN